MAKSLLQKDKKYALRHHAQKRMKQRFGIEINKIDRVRLIEKIKDYSIDSFQDREVLCLGKQSISRTLYLVEYHGSLIKIVFDRKRSELITVLYPSVEELERWRKHCVFWSGKDLEALEKKEVVEESKKEPVPYRFIFECNIDIQDESNMKKEAYDMLAKFFQRLAAKGSVTEGDVTSKDVCALFLQKRSKESREGPSVYSRILSGEIK